MNRVKGLNIQTLQQKEGKEKYEGIAEIKVLNPNEKGRGIRSFHKRAPERIR